MEGVTSRCFTWQLQPAQPTEGLSLGSDAFLLCSHPCSAGKGVSHGPASNQLEGFCLLFGPACWLQVTLCWSCHVLLGTRLNSLFCSRDLPDAHERVLCLLRLCSRVAGKAGPQRAEDHGRPWPEGRRAEDVGPQPSLCGPPSLPLQHRVYRALSFFPNQAARVKLTGSLERGVWEVLSSCPDSSCHLHQT